VGGAGAEECPIVGEMGIDGVPLDTGALSNGRDRRACRPDRCMELDRRFDDALPRLGLASCAFLQLVSTLHCTVVYRDS
jgi:hypothetical protein